jgi:hypothetical protein
MDGSVFVGTCASPPTTKQQWKLSTGPPAPPARYFENIDSGLCLDTKGKCTGEGTTVDQWTCVSAKNEQYTYDKNSGTLVGLNSKRCVSNKGCPQGVTLCIVDCTASPTLWDLHQSTSHFSNDDTFMIAPRGTTGQCLQTADKTMDGSVFVGTCASPPTTKQQWKLSTGPPAPTANVFAGICVRTNTQGSGICLTVTNSTHIENTVAKWQLVVEGEIVRKGSVALDMNSASAWTNLKLTANGDVITPYINGQAQQIYQAGGSGMVALVSGYHVAYFDNFSLSQGSS